MISDFRSLLRSSLIAIGLVGLSLPAEAAPAGMAGGLPTFDAGRSPLVQDVGNGGRVYGGSRSPYFYRRGGGWHGEYFHRFGGYRGGYYGGRGGFYGRPYYRGGYGRPYYRGGYYGRPYYGGGYYGGGYGSGFYLGFGGPLLGMGYYAPWAYGPPVRPVYRSGGGHTGWCYARYRSYRAWDNTYQPYNGPRRQCYSPYR